MATTKIDEASAREAVRGLIGKLDPATLFEMVHQEKRRANHDEAKLAQPKILLSPSHEDLASLRAELLRPFTQAEAGKSGIDYLCQTVKDLLDANAAVEDVVFALGRVWRMAWHMQPHLPPFIEVKGN